jgi:ABC-type protease/lipase transport system fused ATPase/permease subunit
MLQVTISPSSFLDQGICIEVVDGLRLFRLAESLQERLENLLEINQTAALSTEEQKELKSLTDLDRFFTYLNSRLIAQV